MHDTAIERRIEFLLAEARSANPIYCHVVQTCMRVVSNWLIFGCLSSRLAKDKARMSPEARALKQQVDAREFRARTTLEHPYELRSIWERMVGQDRSIEQVKRLLVENEPIVITKSEDMRLRVSGVSGPDRYRAIGLKLDECKRV